MIHLGVLAFEVVIAAALAPKDGASVAAVAALFSCWALRLHHPAPRAQPGVLWSAFLLAVVCGSGLAACSVLLGLGAACPRTALALAGAAGAGQLSLLLIRPGKRSAAERVAPLGDEMARAVKATFDRLVVLALLPIFLPLLLLLAALVRLTTHGPAFYGQIRLTLGARPFVIWKLRSMIQDAEPERRAIWPQEDDPRITPFGRVLRRFWLDEIPQVWNVLRGDMSLVGPRPERPEFVAVFSRDLPTYQDRLAVRAGMTGLAQVRGLTGNTSIRKRLALDRFYIRHWTPGLDVWILAKTVTSALSRLRPR